MSDAERLMNSTGESDVFLLPEMWTTGFAVDPIGVADDGQSALKWMKDAAKRRRAAVSGSVAVLQEGKYYNRHYFCLPDGTVYAYDKHHLFAYGGEDRHYERGLRRVVAEYGGVRFLLLTCYDIRFPEWCRYRGDYDVILCAANWPEQRSLAWDILTRARAVENVCLFAGANRVGVDKNCRYVGRSVIVDSCGRVLASGECGDVTAISAEFDIGMQNEHRRKFPALKEMEY